VREGTDEGLRARKCFLKLCLGRWSREGRPPKCFVVPCLNEEENVLGTIETITKAMERVDCRFEILVFDDGSQDNTSGVVAAYQSANP